MYYYILIVYNSIVAHTIVLLYISTIYYYISILHLSPELCSPGLILSTGTVIERKKKMDN